ncbi:ABC transporter ATP-binding protein [Mycoplasma suis]|uniref:ABC transporter ATP-binding protein n=1 Tax=Mycoplasma suis TaxID=57372 RepID=UPI002351D867|nr:ABC transporter ATP-binding protein [Mycoplasma suis]
MSCNLEKNEFYSIIGPNGAGKTTFLKHLGGILKPTSGKLYVGDKELKNISSKTFWEKTAYIPQELNIQGDTPVYDFLLYSRYSSISRIDRVSNEDHVRTLEVIKLAGIEHLRWNRMGELSGGQRQKVILASILMKDVELILMDEPTTFLDVHNRNFFISFLKRLHLSGKTIIANLHNFTEISNLSTKIIALKDGEIFKMGDKSEILQADVLNELYDLELPSDNWQSLLSVTSSNY